MIRALALNIDGKRNNESAMDRSGGVVDNGPTQVTISQTHILPPEHGRMNRMISIVPPSVSDEGCRKAVHLCLVVDTSGSMGAETFPLDQVPERSGLSLLDIVKHAMRTIVAAMDARDQLSVVSFSTNSRTLFSARKMDEEGKQNSIRDIQTLFPGGQTNLCSGILDGLEIIRSHADNDGRRTEAIFVLTDGVPNISPPRGTLTCVRRYLDQHLVCAGCPISTFGFGYNLDSSQLVEIANVGGGMYSFIPDSGFIGTIFVNAISNLMTTTATNITVDIHTRDDDLFVIGYQHERTEAGYRVRVGTLQYGQSRYIILRGGSIQDATVEMVCNGSSVVLDSVVDIGGEDEFTPMKIEAEVLRCELVQLLATTQDDTDTETIRRMVRRVEDFVNRARAAHFPQIVRSESLLVDITGQVMDAYSRRDWFSRWGRHYLPSLSFAHRGQQCNNFKDPGVQHYGGKMFHIIQDRVDDLFCKLPSPEPMYAPIHTDRVRGSGRNPVNMRSFHNSSGGCISSDSVVALSDGNTKRVDQIVKGDSVVCDAEGNMAEVICMVRMLCTSIEFVVLSDELKITPWHPVRWNKRWRFPSDVSHVRSTMATTDCGAVYNLVLNSHHTVLVGGVECITLGHGVRDDEVARHDFFGTQRVIDVLEECEGWENGVVELQADSMKRCEQTGIVIGGHL